MRDRLEARLPNATTEELDVMMQVIDRYEIKLTVKNLDSDGLILFDSKNRSVRISVGQWRNKSIYIPAPNSDIAIVATGGIIGGWIRSEELEFLEDRFIVDKKMLSPMPDDFCFDVYCPHMTEYGGVCLDGEFWECLGCGKKLVYNDK